MRDIIKIIIQYIKTKYGYRFKSREDLKKWQDKKIKKHIQWVVKKSPYYRELYKGYSLDNWRELPIINKDLMMENFDSLNTKQITKEEAFKIALEAENTRDFSPKIDDITIGLSSGTSGNRGLFLVSEDERIKWAGAALAKVLPTSLFSRKGQKVAFFLRANSNLYTTVNKGKVKFEFFDLLDDMRNHVDKLNKYKPSIVVAPPSMLRILANNIQNGELDINPDKVISVAEVLEPLDKEYIEKHFRQLLHQVYQCTEGFLASTCKYGTLHLNEDIVAIEKNYIDKDLGKFSPIITDFSRTTQPIIRYYLNDILTENKETCACGSVFTPIKQIEGRSDDLFYLPHTLNKELIPIFPDFIRRAIISSSNKINEYKVVQHNLHLIEVNFTANNEYTEQIEAKITRSLTSLFNNLKCKIPSIIVNNKMEINKGIKLRRIERKFKL